MNTSQPPLNLAPMSVEAATSKPLQIAILLDEPLTAVNDNPIEIDAVNLSYKAPRTSKFGAKISAICSSSRRRGAGVGDDGDYGEAEAPKRRLIVKKVSFKAKAGEVMAIAGPSGAGKSTVLELLAGKIRPSSPPESLLVNHKPMHVPTFRRISGYVPQSDALFPLLTVRETLLFSAHLRLPATLSSAEKEQRVNKLIIELRLQHVADNRVGNDDTGLRGISGGERRRVSIGVDVIHDPAVLFLDEPTSGLDSASALNVVEMLHSMAKTRSRTVILSIHQPGYKIIQLIHSFLLLDNGSIMHHGSLQALQRHLEISGLKIPPHVNVLEYAIEAIACNSYHSPRTTPAAPVSNPDNDDDDSDDGEAESSASSDSSTIAAVPTAAPRFACSFAREVAILAQRFMRNVFRTYELFTARTMQALLAGLALGTLYINVGNSDRGVRGLADRLGFFAFTLTFLLSSTVEALPIFLQERVVFIRETSRGAYRISSYMISNLAVFLPFLLFLALLFAGPVYWLVGLSPTPAAFVFFILVVWLVLLSANSFVAFFGALVPDYIMGNSIISGCMGAFFLFSGYFIAKDDMPVYWRFMHYLSMFKYPLDALLINEYTAIPDRCFGSLLPGAPCTITGPEVLLTLGLQNLSKWCPVFMMIIFIVFYRLLCYIVLRFKVCRRKR